MLYNDLALFVATAKELSFSRAAERCSLPPSHVSRRIAALEEQLGTKLFERTTRSVRLTAEGRMLLDRCQTPVEALQNITGTGSGDGRQVLRLTAPPLAARTTIGPRLLAFAELHPELVIDLTTTNTNLDFIRDNIDLAFRLGPMKDSGLIARALWSVPYSFCAGKAFARREKLDRPITRQQLMSLPAILFRQPWHLEEGGSIAPPNVAHIFDDLELVLSAVRRNFGVAMLPSEMLPGDTVVIRVAQTTPVTRTMSAVYPSLRLLPTRVRSLIEFMAAPT
jgi:DNA-binding transcriptional LysR family regulator